MKKIVILTALLLYLTTACNWHNAQDVRLLDGLWTITEIDGTSTICDSVPLEFDIDIEANSFSGNAGCNTISGTITADTTYTNAIVLHATTIGRMMCDDMIHETRLLSALKHIATYQVDTIVNPLQLTFFDDNGDALLKLNYLKSREATEWSINGKWTIKSVNGILTEGTESGTELIFDLADGVVNGHIGCNSISGSMLFDDESISFSDICNTDVYCDSNSMMIEDMVHTVLGYVSRWTVQNGELILSDMSEKNIIVLIKG